MFVHLSLDFRSFSPSFSFFDYGCACRRRSHTSKPVSWLRRKHHRVKSKWLSLAWKEKNEHDSFEQTKNLPQDFLPSKKQKNRFDWFLPLVWLSVDEKEKTLFSIRIECSSQKQITFFPTSKANSNDSTSDVRMIEMPLSLALEFRFQAFLFSSTVRCRSLDGEKKVDPRPSASREVNKVDQWSTQSAQWLVYCSPIDHHRENREEK